MKHKHAIGIELDHYTMRGVVASRTKHGDKNVTISKVAEIHGTFIKDSDVVKGVKSIREQLGIHGKGHRVASVLGGKQVYTSRIAFQKMPDSNMKKALKYEIRKELPFEAANATLEFQRLNNGEVRHDDKVDIMVTASTNALISRHMRLLTEGGMKPAILEALPLMVANTFWIGAKRESVDAANIILHIGPDLSTLVIDGEHLPYFNRLIYFSAEELFAPSEEQRTIAGKERERRITALAEELIRSLSYYEDNFENVSFSTINILGSYTDTEMLDILKQETKLQINVSDLSSRVNSKHEISSGRYDLSIALALQALE